VYYRKKRQKKKEKVGKIGKRKKQVKGRGQKLRRKRSLGYK
jgi:hypothetical protein